MKVLVACERSGVVRRAFEALGHAAVSNDLVPADDGGPHLRGDALEAIRSDWWDIIIMHPPCTYLCGSGLHWNKRRPEREKLTEEALDFVRRLMTAATARARVGWALENPVGLIGTRIRRASQWVQPYWFGEDASKRTGLWLYRLPLLLPRKAMVAGRLVCRRCGRVIGNGADQAEARATAQRYGCRCGASGRDQVERWANQTDSGQNRVSPHEGRDTERSRTYEGIAAAMAAQWGALV